MSGRLGLRKKKKGRGKTGENHDRTHQVKGEFFVKEPSMDPPGKVGANCFRTHNELTMGLLGKLPLAPSEWIGRGLSLDHDKEEGMVPIVDTCLGYTAILGAKLFNEQG